MANGIPTDFNVLEVVALCFGFLSLVAIPCVALHFNDEIAPKLSPESKERIDRFYQRMIAIARPIFILYWVVSIGLMFVEWENTLYWREVQTKSLIFLIGLSASIVFLWSITQLIKRRFLEPEARLAVGLIGGCALGAISLSFTIWRLSGL